MEFSNELRLFVLCLSYGPRKGMLDSLLWGHMASGAQQSSQRQTWLVASLCKRVRSVFLNVHVHALRSQ